MARRIRCSPCPDAATRRVGPYRPTRARFAGSPPQAAQADAPARHSAEPDRARQTTLRSCDTYGSINWLHPSVCLRRHYAVRYHLLASQRYWGISPQVSSLILTVGTHAREDTTKEYAIKNFVVKYENASENEREVEDGVG